jgi:hypothetical protein
MPAGDGDLVLLHRLDELVELLDLLGAADAAGPSVDGESGATLPGLSVNRLSPEPWWDRPARQWVARQVCQYGHLAGGDRYPGVLTGREAGRGPDREPLVVDVHPVARLTPGLVEEAVREYRAAFDPGQMPG